MGIVASFTHEAGDFSEYDSTVTDGGDLSVVTPGLAGTGFKVQSVVDDTNDLFGHFAFTPLTSTAYGVRAYMDPNTLTFAAATRTPEFVRVAIGSGQRRLALRLTRNAGDDSYAIDAQYSLDSGSGTIAKVDITDAPHFVYGRVEYASTDSASDGIVTLFIDGTQVGQDTGLDIFDVEKPRVVRVGSMSPGNGTSGTWFVDQVIVRDDATEIGAHGGIPVSQRVLLYGNERQR